MQAHVAKTTPLKQYQGLAIEISAVIVAEKVANLFFKWRASWANT